MRLVGRDAVLASIPHYQPVGLVSFEDFLHADGCRMVRLRSYNSLDLLVAGTRTSEVFSRDVSTMEGLSQVPTFGSRGGRVVIWVRWLFPV